jgi:hypothetical protein
MHFHFNAFYPLPNTKIQVISSRAKGMIGAFICLILLSAVLVTASTKGWLFGLNKNNGEHVAARIQVSSRQKLISMELLC